MLTIHWPLFWPNVLPLPWVCGPPAFAPLPAAPRTSLTSALLPPSEKVTSATASHMSIAVMKVCFSVSVKAEATSNV